MELAIISNAASAIRTVDFSVSKNTGITYLTGLPKKVKFNGKNGAVIIGRNGEEAARVSAGGNGETTPSIGIIPVRFHAFESKKGLYKNLKTTSWGELFFIDENGELCAALFHGESLDNLKDALRYALVTKDMALGKFSLKVITVMKTSKQGDYFVRRFLSEPETSTVYADWLKANKEPIFNFFTVAEWSVKNKKMDFAEIAPQDVVLFGQEMGIFE